MQNKPWLATYPAGINWHEKLAPQPVFALWHEATQKYGDKPCCDFLGKKFSYAQMNGLVQRAAAGLQALGLKKGDRVALCLPNTPYYLALYFATLQAGGVVVNLNPLYAEKEIHHHLADSGARFVATLDLAALYPKIAAQIGKTPLEKIIVCPLGGMLPAPKNILFALFKKKERAAIPSNPHHILWADLVNTAATPQPVAIDPMQDLAVLQYTGGTTGVPKAAMLTHANVSVNAEQAVLWFPNLARGAERMMAVLPFFHVFAMTAVLNFAIKIGAELIMLPRFELKLLLQTITKNKPTLMPAVPTIYTAINNAPNLSKYNLRSIRYCISGGAGLPVEVKKQFEALTGCVVVEGYGLTEASPVTHCNPIAGENRAGSIGLPFPGTEVEIISLDDHTTILPPGERGELCISGPQVMAGYWRNEAETSNVLRRLPDGRMRLHTGDIAIMETDGYCRIVDRLKDLIICGGFNVYPRHVEEAIYQHPAVAEAVAFGVPDTYRGETVKAVVVLKAGQSATREEMLGFLRDKLSPIEMPKQMEFRESLPKTLIGKIDRKAIKASG